MKASLLQLIEAYRGTQRDVALRLASALGFALPITNIRWVGLRIPQKGKTADGLQYYKHGFGVAIRFEGGEIDFDFGDEGQYDGFDAERLYRFAMDCKLATSYTSSAEVRMDIEEAEAMREIQHSGFLYYLVDPKHLAEVQ